ncbi:MAG: hypothetical protein AMS18_13905 [Gemmatimonas sp. SG8_17]|nr:MAG: hypothetical protein AMS18_13905 [Gemmatimonas sp. SG8_17]
MKSRLLRLAMTLGALLFVVPAAVAQTELPSGVTDAMVAEGGTIFKGAGICFTCHGQDAKGVPGLGADLTDSEWTHSDGSYEKILATIMAGGTSPTGAVRVSATSHPNRRCTSAEQERSRGHRSRDRSQLSAIHRAPLRITATNAPHSGQRR